MTCNEQKNKWSRTEYKKYLINHPVIQHVYVLGQEPLRVYEKQFPAQFEGTGIHHGGLGAGHGGSGLKPQMGSVGAGTGQWLHSPCEVGAGRWEGHSLSLHLLSGFKGLLSQASPFCVHILTVHSAKIQPLET